MAIAVNNKILTNEKRAFANGKEVGFIAVNGIAAFRRQAEEFVQVTGISASPGALSLDGANRSGYVALTFIPANASDKSIVITYSSDSVASVIFSEYDISTGMVTFTFTGVMSMARNSRATVTSVSNPGVTVIVPLN